MELCGNHFFQHLGEEGQVGNGPVVGENFWVKGGFFQEGSDDRCLQSRRNMAGLKGEVNGCGDKGTYCSYMGF